jgi:uncharacterized membrane protein (UPF0127 family)
MFLTPILRDAARPHQLTNARDGAVLADRIEIASDSRSRRKGLLGRDRMAPGAALVIAPCGGIHTFWMRFSIDVIFVKKDGRVVKCVDSIPPWRMALAVTAYAAIELPAGTIRLSKVSAGDRLIVVPAGMAPDTADVA